MKFVSSLFDRPYNNKHHLANNKQNKTKQKSETLYGETYIFQFIQIMRIKFRGTKKK